MTQHVRIESRGHGSLRSPCPRPWQKTNHNTPRRSLMVQLLSSAQSKLKGALALFGVYLSLVGFFGFSLFIMEESIQTVMFSTWQAEDVQEWGVVARACNMMESIAGKMYVMNRIGGWLNPLMFVAYDEFGKAMEARARNLTAPSPTQTARGAAFDEFGIRPLGPNLTQSGDDWAFMSAAERGKFGDDVQAPVRQALGAQGEDVARAVDDLAAGTGGGAARPLDAASAVQGDLRGRADFLRNSARAFYNALDDSGTRVSGRLVRDLDTAIGSRLRDAGITIPEDATNKRPDGAAAPGADARRRN